MARWPNEITVKMDEEDLKAMKRIKRRVVFFGTVRALTLLGIALLFWFGTRASRDNIVRHESRLEELETDYKDLNAATKERFAGLCVHGGRFEPTTCTLRTLP